MTAVLAGGGTKTGHSWTVTLEESTLHTVVIKPADLNASRAQCLTAGFTPQVVSILLINGPIPIDIFFTAFQELLLKRLLDQPIILLDNVPVFASRPSTCSDPDHGLWSQRYML